MSHIFAVIPARKGSTRLPGKNSKILGGKPLIQWTIECAQQSRLFDRIIVSTDDPVIETLSKTLLCDVPGLRKESLSADTSNLIDVCLDIIQKFSMNSSDIIVLLQPTSPFRKPSTIQNALSLLENGNAHSVVSFSPCPLKPQWVHTLRKDGYIEPLFAFSAMLNQISQDTYLIPNGLIYASNTENIKKYNNFFTSKTLPLLVNDDVETLDIDTQDDFEKAQLLEHHNKDKTNAF